MSKEPKLITCKHCGSEIAATAKACPQCGGKNKKPIYKRGWFIALVIIVIIGIAGNMGGTNESEQNLTNSDNTASSVTPDSDTTNTETEDTQTSEQNEPAIVYTPYDVSVLMSDLDNNALKAAETYDDQYVTLTGRLSNIDSSGKYISIVPTDDEWAIIGVQCYIKNEDQKNAVMEMSVGDTIVVSGKITSVGEVLGYSLDIDNFG